MTIDEKKYARKRISDIKQMKLSAIRKKHTIEKEPLTSAKMATLIASGKVKLKKEAESQYGSINSFFDFSEYQTKFDEKSYKKDAEPIERKALEIEDLIVL